MEDRLQKIIASAGFCSRRTAEEWIIQGRISVNGITAVLGQKAQAGEDLICVDGKSIDQVPQKVYLMLNKPRGYVTTLSDEKGRPTAASLVADCGLRVYPVGRLDLDSEGLLLFTNDGEWMQRVLHPKYEVTKTYHVLLAGEVSRAAERLSAITEIEGEKICPAQVTVLRQGKDTAELCFTIHEGKNRQIRRMCAGLSLHVKRLKRVKEDNIALSDLPEGKWRYLTVEEVRSFE